MTPKSSLYPGTGQLGSWWPDLVSSKLTCPLTPVSTPAPPHFSFCGPLSQHHCHPASPVPSLSPVPDSAHQAQLPHLTCFSTCLLPFHWRPSPRPSTHPSGFIALLLSLRTPSYHPADWRAERVVHCYTASRSSSGDSGSIPVGTPSPGCDESDCAASHPATGPPRATRGPTPSAPPLL